MMQKYIPYNVTMILTTNIAEDTTFTNVSNLFDLHDVGLSLPEPDKEVYLLTTDKEIIKVFLHDSKTTWVQVNKPEGEELVPIEYGQVWFNMRTK